MVKEKGVTVVDELTKTATIEDKIDVDVDGELVNSGDKFKIAPEVAQIAQELIIKYHQHLRGANIRYLFRYGPWSNKKRETQGQAVKVSGVNHFLTGLDFIILINADVWEQLNEKEKVALVDHELEHCCKEDDKFYLQGHDVEDFIRVIRRHGFWSPNLKAVKHEAVQGMLNLVVDEKPKLEIIN